MKTVEGRASEFDFIQLYFYTVTYDLTEIWHFLREKSRSIYKSTRERVDRIPIISGIPDSLSWIPESRHLFPRDKMATDLHLLNGGVTIHAANG